MVKKIALTTDLQAKKVRNFSALESDDDPPETKMRLCAIANCALELRGQFPFFQG